MSSGDRTIAVINAKGGVGKTTTVANMAGQLAGTYRVLVLDLDPQGHLGVPYGFYKTETDDAGMRIVDAIQNDTPLPPPLTDVRPGLDVFPGGARLVRLQGIEMSGEVLQGVVTSFAEKLTDIADDYDFILLDCPPGDRLIQQMALAAARYVLAPIDTGVGATESLRDHLAPLVTRARRENPELTYLGAIVCKQPKTAKRVLRNTRVRLGEFSEHVPVFESVIRNAVKPAQDSEQRGQLLHELAGQLAASNREQFEKLAAVRAADREASNNGEARARAEQARSELREFDPISSTAADLAADYRNLAIEVVQRVASHEDTVPLRKSR